MTNTSVINAVLYYLGIAAIVAVGFLAGCSTSSTTSKAASYPADDQCSVNEALNQQNVNYISSVAVHGTGVGIAALTLITPTTMTIGRQTFTC